MEFFKKSFLKISALIMCIVFLCLLVAELNFFITQKQTEAHVINIDTGRNYIKYTFTYFNEYLNRIYTTSLKFKDYSASKAKDIINKEDFTIKYVKFLPNDVYVDGLNTPRLLSVVLFLILFLLFLFYLLPFFPRRG